MKAYAKVPCKLWLNHLKANGKDKQRLDTKRGLKKSYRQTLKKELRDMLEYHYLLK